MRNVDRRDSSKINKQIERNKTRDLEDQEQGEILRQSVKPSKQWGVDTTNPTSYVDTPSAPIIPAPSISPVAPDKPSVPTAPVEVPAPSTSPVSPPKKDKEELKKPELKPQLAPPVILAPSTGVSPQTATATATSRIPPRNSNAKLDGKKDKPNRKKTTGDLDFDIPLFQNVGKELSPGNFTLAPKLVKPNGKILTGFDAAQNINDRRSLGIAEEESKVKFKGKPLSPGNFKLAPKISKVKSKVLTGYDKDQEINDRRSLGISEQVPPVRPRATVPPRSASPAPAPTPQPTLDDFNDNERRRREIPLFNPDAFTSRTREPPAKPRNDLNVVNSFDGLRPVTTAIDSRIAGASRRYSRDLARQMQMQKLQKTQKESVITTLKSMINENVSEMQLNISESSIKINTTMAKKVVDVYESLNKDNKKKMEDMLSESVDSFKKILSFSVRQ